MSAERARPARRKPSSIPARGWFLIKESISAWIDDYAPSMGAAIAYYTVFSLAPLLVIVIAVAALVFGQEAAQGQIVAQLRGLMGEEGALAVQGLIKNANEPAQGTVATIVSIITLIIGATTVFGELQSALDRIWRAPAAKKSSGIFKLLRTRLLSFGMVLGLGFLLLVSLVVSAGLAALGNWWAGFFDAWEPLLHALEFVISFALVTVLFAAIYKIMPRVDIAWRDVWVGAAVTALLFNIGKILIGLYLGKATITATFGAAGSLAVLLIWVYYSAQIFLLGAEFTWVYAHEHGSRRGQPREEAETTAAPRRTEGAARPTNTRTAATHGESQSAAFTNASPASAYATNDAVFRGAAPGGGSVSRGKGRDTVKAVGAIALIGLAIGAALGWTRPASQPADK